MVTTLLQHIFHKNEYHNCILHEKLVHNNGFTVLKSFANVSGIISAIFGRIGPDI